ncbi:hypothetical protein [Cognaticolwellia beringensis]|uniref:hypothetical protein n=1 Tax=Cognaticolwellia beringensis TaxID=1967665 RepID=UPI0012F72954|nr:hypothetical protein [Cognaticolwellia beringensis]
MNTTFGLILVASASCSAVLTGVDGKYDDEDVLTNTKVNDKTLANKHYIDEVKFELSSSGEFTTQAYDLEHLGKVLASGFIMKVPSYQIRFIPPIALMNISILNNITSGET